MTNVSAVEKMAELMQRMEENSPRVAALQYCLKQVAEKVEEAEKRNAELESGYSELAAELRAVEEIHNEAVFITDDHYEQCPPEVQNIIRSLAVMQIPAYHAFLAEVRAQGVEMLNTQFKKCTAMLYADSVVSTAEHFAAQLRKGAQS
ncbi:hypothetical protein [Enterobacter hormaechei]|uniref:hypothetical protein n=1 Tax=Enterobacter hormaechei TaxID=158836 RepID=UPI003906A05D